jgi:hypothetical protein
VAATSTPEPTVTPPYPPWSTFRGFFLTLKNTAIPPQIDSSVMSRMSGSAQKQVTGALRFFGLIDDAGVVQPDLRNLVSAADTEGWDEYWSDIFFNRYQRITGDLDTDSATLKQLADRFRDTGKISGSVLRKALRFYLDGLEATGVSYSPHFKTRGLGAIAGDRGDARRRGSGTPRNGTPAISPDAGSARERTPPHRDPPPPLADVPDAFVIRLPGRAPVVLPLPADLREPEWDYIDKHVRGYIFLREGGE